MNIKEILLNRRAVRKYDSEKKLDSAIVRGCIEQATLSPTSSNMQLWECYHVTDPEVLGQLSVACLGQQSARTAQELVVFVVRPDFYRDHARKVLEFEKENIKRHSPESRQEHRIKAMELYYGKLMPFVYCRSFGVVGAFRKLLARTISLFKPILREVSEADMRVVMHKSCGMAAQTFMMAMSEAGYDTCPLEGFDSKRVKKILNLPRAAQVNMIITCGIRKPEGVRGDRYRIPFEEVYHKV